MDTYEPEHIFRGYTRLIPDSLPSLLPWSVFERLRIGHTIPIIGTHPFRTMYSVAWHMKPESQGPHSRKYRLKRAICEGDIKEVSKIASKMELDKPVDLEHGMTGLMLAAKFNRVHILKYIILKGADVDAVDAEGNTALMHAVNNMSFESLRVLVENGADMDRKDNNGISPYQKTVLKNFYFMQLYLQESKNKFTTPDLPRFKLNFEIDRTLDAIVDAIAQLQGVQYMGPVPYPFNNLKETYLVSLINKSPTI